MRKAGWALLFLTATPFLLADDAKPTAADNREAVSNRFVRLRQELLNDLTNRLITSDQFNAELTKIDQLKIQEHADAAQNNNGLSHDQRTTYNDLLSQIQREIELMETATPQSGNAVVPAAVPIQTGAPGQSERAKLYARFQAVRAELTDDLNNHLITADQFNTELGKLNLLKTQEHADAAQDLLKGEQTLYSDQLNQIQTEVNQMIETNSAPAAAQ